MVYLHSGESVCVVVRVRSKTAVVVVDGLQLSDVLENHRVDLYRDSQQR